MRAPTPHPLLVTLILASCFLQLGRKLIINIRANVRSWPLVRDSGVVNFIYALERGTSLCGRLPRRYS
jgi:hypothetical protein